MKMKIKPSQTALKVGLNIIALSHVKKMKGVLPDGIVSATSELLKNSEATTLKRIEKHHSPKILKIYKNLQIWESILLVLHVRKMKFHYHQ